MGSQYGKSCNYLSCPILPSLFLCFLPFPFTFSLSQSLSLLSSLTVSPSLSFFQGLTGFIPGERDEREIVWIQRRWGKDNKDCWESDAPARQKQQLKHNIQLPLTQLATTAIKHCFCDDYSWLKATRNSFVPILWFCQPMLGGASCVFLRQLKEGWTSFDRSWIMVQLHHTQRQEGSGDVLPHEMPKICRRLSCRQYACAFLTAGGILLWNQFLLL